MAIGSPRKTDVHTRHCCKNCGCKYGEGNPDGPFDTIGCSVVSGQLKQEYECGKNEVCNEYYWFYRDQRPK